MVHKIIQLENLGRFKKLAFGGEYWNGIFDNVNVLYAQNGAGKSTFSLMFRSWKDNNELLLKKKSFNSDQFPKISFINHERKQINYLNNHWNEFCRDIEVFDAHFIEENIYIISLNKNKNSNTVFEILLGNESIKIKNEINRLKKARTKLRNSYRSLKNKKKNNLDKEEIYKKKIVDNRNQRTTLTRKISAHEIEIINLSAHHRDHYLEKINYYLCMFTPNLQLTKLKQRGNKIVYGLEVHGHKVRSVSDESAYSLKYTLSEGDKNALAISFFFAKVELLPNLSSKTIVIDDPITSFDYLRKNATIRSLIRLSNQIGMLILLTHDLHFANEFSKKINYKCSNLKIVQRGQDSQIVTHNIVQENLTGIFKDLTVLNDFLKQGSTTDFELREIVRCIRPVLEGIFRIKFFNKIGSKEWLGDIIEKIRASSTGEEFFYLKEHLSEITDINDYSKEYHHSSPYNYEPPINNQELNNYVIRTLNLLKKI